MTHGNRKRQKPKPPALANVIDSPVVEAKVTVVEADPVMAAIEDGKPKRPVGRPPVANYCPRCGVRCDGALEARLHCASKRLMSQVAGKKTVKKMVKRKRRLSITGPMEGV